MPTLIGPSFVLSLISHRSSHSHSLAASFHQTAHDVVHFTLLLLVCHPLMTVSFFDPILPSLQASLFLSIPFPAGASGHVFYGSFKGDDVAVKLMTVPAGMPASEVEEQRRSFLREVELWHSLCHPNIVQVRWGRMRVQVGADAGAGRCGCRCR